LPIDIADDNLIRPKPRHGMGANRRPQLKWGRCREQCAPDETGSSGNQYSRWRQGWS
jgi:hypothetical protein